MLSNTMGIWMIAFSLISIAAAQWVKAIVLLQDSYRRRLYRDEMDELGFDEY